MEIDDALAQEWLTFWQKQLRLQDWKITVRLRRHFDMRAGTTGRAEIVLPNKSALIDLLDPHDCEVTYPPYDPEKTLVHELTHLHLEPFCPKDDTLEHTMMEQAIESLTTAMVTLQRNAGER